MAELGQIDGDDVRRMTYAELAKARGISLPAARRLTLRHRWAKHAGNDGLVRVSVPASALGRPRRGARADAAAIAAAIDTTTSVNDATPDPRTDAASDTTHVLRTLERAIDGLREQYEHERQRADRAERLTEELRGELMTARIAEERAVNELKQIRQRRRHWWPWGRRTNESAS